MPETEFCDFCEFYDKIEKECCCPLNWLYYKCPALDIEEDPEGGEKNV